MVKFTFNCDQIKSSTGFGVKDVVAPEYTGGFDRDKYWETFADLHSATTELELVTLILDIARCHYSPKVENWPGVTVIMNTPAGNIDIKLEAGKTKAKPFQRGKGKVYNWSKTCLATAGVFVEVFWANPELRKIGPKGHFEFYGLYCSTLHGWTIALQDSCSAAFEKWAKDNGCKALDATAKAKIRSSIETYMKGKNKIDCALNVKNIVRFLIGEKLDEGEIPIYIKP